MAEKAVYELLEAFLDALPTAKSVKDVLGVEATCFSIKMDSCKLKGKIFMNINVCKEPIYKYLYIACVCWRKMFCHDFWSISATE